ncbi:tetratricopeptide repeat protein [Gemmata sp. JC717]|uniref:tetratricopeptide repeat protein n=1 Tax=Gemmata algarum TaxID=2975278 RepID=UPI0021BA6250|nr:tetratricopeptide repeat protein [Gemmata algarum]MDY3553554.1 tetratricopeptide repeat protein [Gemmata algarum]
MSDSLPDPSRTAPQTSDAPAAPVAFPSRADRYELQGVLARGGMGEVHEARDTVLNRRVAVKVIQGRFAADPAVTRRFLDEAQITGQLQHLGVPPVHDLGALPDGRPFLVMKLIKGQTLSDRLRERPAPGHERARFVQVFEQICQTVAYAHSRNVIHRDLKPANVMIGAFGEVQVMDWGLAKVLTSAPEGCAAESGAPDDTGPASEIELSHDADPLTRAGSAFGTPQYMPPEQAQGEWAAVGPRADVFALGGILCEVLTGRPPYTGKTAEVRAKAVLGTVGDALARLDACGAEPELVELAKQCLSPNPEDRPADGAAVADRVAAFRAGVELRIERERLARNADAVGALLKQCEAALQNDDAASTALLLEQAERRAVEGADGFGPRLARARADLTTLQELDRIEDLRWTVSDNKLTPRAVIVTAWAEALRRHGIVPGATTHAAVGKLLRESVIGRRLLATLDQWFASEPSDALLELLGAIDPNAYRCRVREAIRAGDTKRLTRLAGQPDALQLAPQFATALSEQESVRPERRTQILRAAHERQPDSLLVLMALASPGAAPADAAGERVGWCRAALALRPKNAAVWNNLGITLRQRGDVDGAVEAYRQAVRFAPTDATVRYNLGIALHAKGELAAAAESYREAIKLEPGYAKAHSNLGLILHDLGASDQELATHRRAIACDPSFARAHYNLGNALAHQGELDAAIAAYRDALRLDPDYAPAHHNLGIALQKSGDLGGAVEAIREAARRDLSDAAAPRTLAAVLEKKGDLAGAAAAYREATERDAKDAVTFFRLGWLLDRMGQSAESRAAFRRAGKLDKRYAKCATGSRVEILKALNFTA